MSTSFNTWSVILLTLHVIGEFYLPTGTTSENKKTTIVTIASHNLCYSVFFILMGFASLKNPIIYWILFAALHLLVDFLFLAISKSDNDLFLFRQLTHVISVVIFSYVLSFFGNSPVIKEYIKVMIEIVWQGSLFRLLKTICAVLIIIRPSNVIIRHLLNQPLDTGTPNRGRYIGALERIIMLILISMSQFSAIGLVLTMKSIARFEEIKDKGFAEYYLLGTLLSTVSVLIVYFLLLRQ